MIDEDVSKGKGLISVRESANYLGVSESMVRRFIANKILQPVRLGRRVLLQTSEIDRFISVHRSDRER
jgi:excisionase family DNA binding protein